MATGANAAAAAAAPTPTSTTLLNLPTDSCVEVLKRCAVMDLASMALVCKGLRAVVNDDALWQQLAEAKFGPACRELKPLADADAAARLLLRDANHQHQQQGHNQGHDHGQGQQQQPAAQQPQPWRLYCFRRMSARSIPQSPLQLLQELYGDPFQHIVCCVLCARTSGSDVIRGAVAAFLQRAPTPSAALAAADAELMPLLHPLGLQDTRLAAVRAVSRAFLATDWRDPREFWGCGRFVSDSWRVFCRGERNAATVDDVNLKRWLSWANRQLRSDGSGSGSGLDAGDDATADAPAKRKARAAKAAKPSARDLRAAKRAKVGGGGRAAAAGGAAAPARVTRAAAAAAPAVKGGAQEAALSSSASRQRSKRGAAAAAAAAATAGSGKGARGRDQRKAVA